MKLVMLILGLLTPTPHRTETKKWADQAEGKGFIIGRRRSNP